MQLGHGVLIAGDFGGLFVPDDLRLPDTDFTPRPVFLLAAGWQPTGDLLILSYRSRELVLPLHKASEGSQVLLAPFGWSGSIRMSSNAVSPAQSDNQQSEARPPQNWRSSCLAILEQHGISLSKELDWVTISVHRESTESCSQPIQIEWPAQLCFKPLEQGREVKEDFGERLSATKSLVDPLAAAETWFITRGAGEGPMEEQRRSNDPRDDEESEETSEDETIPPGLQTIPTDMHETQVVGGMYPTPPDGDKSQSVGALVPRTHPAKSKTEGSQRADNESTEELQISENRFDPAPTAQINLGSYDHLEDDDLLGDVQAQLYRDNGVTEDDFSFFDKPDEASLTPMDTDPKPLSKSEPSGTVLQAESGNHRVSPTNPKKKETDLPSVLESPVAYLATPKESDHTEVDKASSAERQVKLEQEMLRTPMTQPDDEKFIDNLSDNPTRKAKVGNKYHYAD